jgi:hypothetical protein
MVQVRGLRRSTSAPVGIVALLSVTLVTGGLIVAAMSSARPSGSLASVGVVTSSSLGDVGHSTAVSAPSNVVGSGDVVNWSDSYLNTGPDPANGTVTKSWSTTRETYVPGTFAAPYGWIRQWSTNGGLSWLATEPSPATSVNSIRAVSGGALPANGATGVVSDVSAPSTARSFGVRGSNEDSYQLSFYGQNVYSLPHHDNPVFPCFNKVTGTSCGVVQRPDASQYKTPFKADPYVDQATGFAYIPVTSSNGSMNLICTNLRSGGSCGQTNLGTSGPDQGGAPASATWSYGFNVYFLYVPASTGSWVMGCVDRRSMTVCPGGPYSLGLSPLADEARAFVNLYWSPDSVTPYRADGRVFYTVGKGGSPYLECFDAASNTRCSGVAEADLKSVYTPFPTTDATGALSGLCGRSSTGMARCFDLTGAPSPISAVFAAWLPVGNGWAHGNATGSTATAHGTRVYYIRGANPGPQFE